ncbi:Chemotaxis protein CheY [uncultured Clostridium sp.]|uniref:response regulator transcription factor n=1 Tax=uncultured Clostridium sp. TaxID=59620 RepID=UPI000821B35D|nr:response regulator [uncultured Clostridium sp.]SCJ38794.1 Chemotaxis protein CheY [uncultured Clostridium sp.]
MGKYCRVLIVEDEFIMRQGIKHMINWESEGFTIVGEATNGKEALDLIEEVRPNIIISDIVMPILDGVDFSKLVQKKYPEVQIVILSSYDKFEYVKDTLLSGAVDYILKPTLTPANLIKTLKKAVNRIPGMKLIKNDDEDYHSFIEKYILGYENVLNEKRFIEVFPHSCFRILGIDIKGLYEKNEEIVQDVISKLDQFFQENTEYKNIKSVINDRNLFYTINYKLSDDKDIVVKIDSFIRDNICNNNLFFVITEKFTNLLDIKHIYNEKFAPFIIQQFYYEDINLLCTEKCIKEKSEKFDFDKFYNEVKIKEFDVAISKAEIYINHAISVKMNEQKLKNLIKNLIYTILVSIEEYCSNTDELRDRYFNIVEKALYSEALKEDTKVIFMELKMIISENCKEEDSIKNILEYINNNYASCLDLGAISQKFNFNYSYLSSYFSNHCKEGFSEYLNKIRVEKACELLKGNKYYVSEISSMVGYSDHSYFCRVFKKSKGYTPSKYRRLKLGMENKHDKE